MKISQLGPLSKLGLAVGFFGAFGCSAEGLETAEGPEETGVSSEVAAATTSVVTDTTGTISVAITPCDYQTILSGTLGVVRCTVHPGYALVGGGAEIEGDPHPGGLLTGSYPDLNTQQWVAEAKEHNFATSFSLRAYAIGLKLNGVTVGALRTMIANDLTYQEFPDDATTGSIGGKAVIPNPPTALRVLIGGGAKSMWDAQGRLLVASRPELTPTPGWTATTKDHGLVSTGKLGIYALALPRCPPGYKVNSKQWCLKADVTTFNTAQVPTGYDSARGNVSGPVTAVGGWATYPFGKSGRLLTDLIPAVRNSTSIRVYAESKDHGSVTEGSTVAYALRLAPTAP